MFIVFARVKESRQQEYLQIVENYREAGKVKQRLVLYVGRYDSIDEALQRMPKHRRRLRARATRAVSDSTAEGLRHEADALDERLRVLRRLVEAHPDLVERDRERAERHRRRQAEAARKRREAKGSDQQKGVRTIASSTSGGSRCKRRRRPFRALPRSYAVCIPQA
jgi:hypothetical protein